jgi:drug/metabolite transporter (DMT)-like permease
LIAGKPDGAGTPWGIALSLASLFVFLGWLIALKRTPKGPETVLMPAVIIVIAALTILPVALLLHGAPKLALSPVAWAGIVGQGLISTLLTTVAWQYGSSRVGSATAGVFINIEPMLGSVLGVLLFGDHLHLGLLIGGAMILIGSFVVVLGESATPPGTLAHDAPATPG